MSCFSDVCWSWNLGCCGSCVVVVVVVLEVEVAVVMSFVGVDCLSESAVRYPMVVK